MGYAISLFLAVPEWYFSTSLSPFSAGFLGAIPALGIPSLAVGVVVGFAKRQIGLLIFLLLPAASQILVVVAGFLRGAFQHDTNQLWIIGAFMLLQIAGAGYRLAAGRRKVAGGSDSNFHFIICTLCGFCRRNGIYRHVGLTIRDVGAPIWSRAQ